MFELSFRDFLQEARNSAKEKGIELSEIDAFETDMLNLLREDGFSDEQIYEMNMKRILSLFLKVAEDEVVKIESDVFGKMFHRGR